MFSQNQPPTLVSVDTSTMTPNSADSTNLGSALSERVKDRNENEKAVKIQADKGTGCFRVCTSQDPTKSSSPNDTQSRRLEVNPMMKHSRSWNDFTEDAEISKKKMKMEDDGNRPFESPPRNQSKLPPMGWLQQSPIEQRCAADETPPSSSSSRSNAEQHEDHLALLSGSFDTISVCPSAMDTVQEEAIGVSADYLLSPRQKTDENEGSLLSPKRKNQTFTPNSKTDQRVERKHPFNTSLGTQNDVQQRYHKDSPHSPPQRVIHFDGDDNDCGDISPIKFSPPTESPSQSETTCNFNSNHPYEQTKAAEVSFDNSAGSTDKTDSFHKRRENNGERRGSYSASTLTEAKTPPRRGTNRVHATNGAKSVNHGYKPLYSMAPPLPRDIAYPHGTTGYHPHHPPLLAEGNFPPRDSSLQNDESRGYYRGGNASLVYNGYVNRGELSSPIRPSRPTYRTRSTKETAHPYSSDSTPTKYERNYSERPWIGHGYTSTPRGYPPPRAHQLTKYNNSYYWNSNKISQHERHGHYPTAIPTQEIVTHNPPKGRTPNVPPATDARNHYHYSQPIPHTPTSSSTVIPVVSSRDPFDLIRSIRKIFQGCSYLLYPVHMGIEWGCNRQILHTDAEDLKVARRRIESAICALGGYIKNFQERADSSDSSPSSSNASRRCLGYHYKYRNRFHKRYFVGDHGVSWEVEEDPPVLISPGDEASIQSLNRNDSRNSGTGSSSTSHPKEDDGRPKQSIQNETSQFCQPISSDISKVQLNQLSQQKMKYRCKLCGQPKQNHVCPYRKSLVRTLGIMVCPAVNAYNSAEPGELSPPLSEMNNFVPYGRSGEISDFDTDVSRGEENTPSSSIVTPGGSDNQNDRNGRQHSPATSSLSTLPQSEHQENHFPSQGKSSQQKRYLGGQILPKNLWQKQKHSTEFRVQQPLFMTLALRPEHYRAVTPRAPYRNGSSSAQALDERDGKEEILSFEYPHVPLTFLGRKRLTDTLFYLSQRIPSVTADVASLLRMARERDEWDLAVSEVLTQIVVCIHCSSGDYRLDGLKNYLLKIGIAS